MYYYCIQSQTCVDVPALCPALCPAWDPSSSKKGAPQRSRVSKCHGRVWSTHFRREECFDPVDTNPVDTNPLGKESNTILPEEMKVIIVESSSTATSTRRSTASPLPRVAVFNIGVGKATEHDHRLTELSVSQDSNSVASREPAAAERAFAQPAPAAMSSSTVTTTSSACLPASLRIASDHTPFSSASATCTTFYGAPVGPKSTVLPPDTSVPASKTRDTHVTASVAFTNANVVPEVKDMDAPPA